MNIKRIIAVAVSAGLLAWLMADGRWRGLGEVFARLDGLTLGLAAAGFGLSYLLRALRIFDEFRTQAGGRFGSCLRITLIHNAMINVVPFRGGEAAFPLLLRQNFGVPLPRAIASLFWFRLQDAFVVMALAAIVWPGVHPHSLESQTIRRREASRVGTKMRPLATLARCAGIGRRGEWRAGRLFYGASGR